MPYPLPPGVYFESADPPIGGVVETRTDVAGFVGLAERGPLHEPVRVDSWTQFETRFGRRFLPYSYLPDAVHGFFANGGRAAWVVRVGRPVDKAELRHAGVYLVNAWNEPVFLVQAKDPGLGGETISVRVTRGVGERFHLQVSAGDGAVVETWRDLEANEFLPANPAIDTGQPPKNDRYIELVINGVDADSTGRTKRPAALRVAGSVLIAVKAVAAPSVNTRVVGVARWHAEANADSSETLPAKGPIFTAMRLGWGDGAHGSRGQTPPWPDRSVINGLKLDHFIGDRASPLAPFGLSTLELVDEVAIVAIPDLTWTTPAPQRLPIVHHPCADEVAQETSPPEVRKPLPPEHQLRGQLAMLDQCMRLRDRFAVLDAPSSLSPDKVVEEWASKLHSFSGQFGALYYPWIGVPAQGATLRRMPPSGHVAGVYARVDLLAGVQKSPANELLSEVQSVGPPLTAEVRGQLNYAGVNVLTATASRGVRVMGARTLIDARDPGQRPWQYVAVRRLVMMIEESLDETAQRFVHGGNQRENWIDLEGVVRNFLMAQWRSGRLDGRTPDEAFSVECNARTNPSYGRDRGQMICEIGVQPPQPSEFVFVRLGGRGNETGAWKLGASHG